MPQYRAEFDAGVAFTTGGGLRTQGFRVDVPHADVTRSEIAELFVSSPRIEGFGTFPVRAYATVPSAEPHDHHRSAGWQPS